MTNKRKIIIIAEAGVNHNGDLSLAKELVDIAVDAGADFVKFQTFTAEEVVSTHAEQAEYQSRNTGISQSQLDMIKKLELAKADFIELYKYCKKSKINFLSTAFDIKNLNFLIKECRIPCIKIPSGELTNAPFLYEIGKLRLPLILSTGMANLDEIGQALAVLSYGWSRNNEPSSVQQCFDYYATDEGRNILNDKINILQCVTEYPAPYKDTNLRAMQTIAQKFKVATGLSDHSKGIHIPVAAVAMGATIIEKHYTKDRNLPGPDHKASLEPNELKDMVQFIRDTENAMGDGIKRPQQSEIKNIAIARRSIVASETIKKGEIYTNNNITCKRPGDGKTAMLYWDMLGQKCLSEVEKDQVVDG